MVVVIRAIRATRVWEESVKFCLFYPQKWEKRRKKYVFYPRKWEKVPKILSRDTRVLKPPPYQDRRTHFIIIFTHNYRIFTQFACIFLMRTLTFITSFWCVIIAIFIIIMSLYKGYFLVSQHSVFDYISPHACLLCESYLTHVFYTFSPVTRVPYSCFLTRVLCILSLFMCVSF